MSINIFKGVELSIPKLRESLKYACAGDQFLAGTKNIWWLFFCVDCLPVLGQVTLLFLRSARLLGRVFPLYRSPMLCLSRGPSSITTEIPVSCSPPHLLQETKTWYLARECLAEGTASPIGSFS